MIGKPPISPISSVRLPTLIPSLTASPAKVLSASGTCHASFPPQSVCILFSMTFPEHHTPAPSCHADISLNIISSKGPDLTDTHTHMFSLSFTSKTCRRYLFHGTTTNKPTPSLPRKSEMLLEGRRHNKIAIEANLKRKKRKKTQP